MPTSQYVYADANETPGPGGTIRRRSQRIHRKSLAKAQTLQHDDDGDEGVVDPNETILGDDDKDETVLLSFEETDGNHDYNGGGIDDGLKPHHSMVDAMDVDEKGGRGVEDQCLRRSRFCQQPSMNEVPKSLRGGNGGVLSDDPLTSSTTESVPSSALRARQVAPTSTAQISTTERLRRLADQLGSDESDDDENSMDMSGREFIREVARKRAQHEALLAESQPLTQQYVAVGLNESEDTDKIVNHNETSSFDRTGPWEKEIDSLDLRMHGHDQLQSNREEYPSTHNVQQNQSSSANHQYDSQNSQLNSHPNRFQPNQFNQLPPYQRNNEQVRQITMSRTTHQDPHGAANAHPNPYLRKERMPTSTTTNVPKRSLEQTKSRQQVHMSDRETWQEEAFRSSLLELLGAFPSHYFYIGDETSTAGNQTRFLATGYIEDDSPHSTTSQRTASAQLNRQRLFDAASRSLARLAIASRHGTKRDSSNDRGETPDFDPPSPRSLPAYMSVMNVYDDSNNEGSTTTHWGAGNSNGVFSGRSVHGRSARTLHLSRTPQGSGSPSSSFYSSWTLEQLAFGSLVLAARVCSEASCDRSVEQKNRWHSNSVPESCRVARFAQRSSIMQGENMTSPVSSALVGSSLGLLATAFACLDSDLVYSVLKVPVTMNDGALPVTVFDVISDFAPVPTENPLTDDIYPVSTLSLLALTRGFEAVIDVARHSTMDPSSVCAAYTSPHDVCCKDANVAIDTGVDKSGVGWLSALGRDLGLKLEDTRNSVSKHQRLSEIARCSYEFVLSFNPMTVNDGSNMLLMSSKHHDNRVDKKRGNSRDDLCIDVTDGRGNQGTHSFACRQHSVMTDRVYAANAALLAAMIQAGIVSDWLSNDSNNVDHSDPGESRLMKVNNLCQKLFNIIETAARLRRSVKQSNALPDPGDGEAVCTSSLSLLLLVLPKHVEQTSPVSLSASFRQMGNSSGSVEDLLHSPLVRNMVELALSWQFPTSSNEYNSMISDNVKSRASTNSVNILSELCMVGGASLICTHFRERLDEFLHNLIRFICERGKNNAAPNWYDCSTVGSSLLLFLRLHTGSPIFVRQFLRNFLEDSSASRDDCAKDFVGGLLHFATDESYSVSSCASSLLRALIDGNPADRTQDRLCLMLLGTFDAEIVASPVEHALHLLFDGADTSVTRNIPFYFTRYHPRKCFLGDLICVCTHTKMFAPSMTDDLLSKFENTIKYDPQQSQYDSLSAAAPLVLINFLASFANTRNGCDDIGDSTLAQQSRVKERLRKVLVSVVAQLESAMRQGASVDITHRALQLQNALIPLSDDRFLALCCTNASSAVAIRERILRDRLTSSQVELLDVVKRSQIMQLDYDNLNNAYHNQRQTYERQIEWITSESRMKTKHVSGILADERKQAEEQCAKEREAKLRAELNYEQLARESSNDKLRIKDLEQLLARERELREDFESQLEMCKKELGQTSMELERITCDNCELEDKLLVSENKVSNLLSTRKEVEANLEDTCSKLIMLATVYQRNEVEVEKYKSELRTAMNTANMHADVAIGKYENARKHNKLLSKQLEEVTTELNSTKAHRADVQRMRKNAPVAYLNQLHSGNLQGRSNRSGKENAYDAR